jgi:transposase
VAAFGVEGTGSYGLGLARFLRRHGAGGRPPRKGQRRLQGKSDPVDAEHAARAVLAGSGPVTPKTGEGAVEAIRLLKVARDTAVVAHSQAMITLKATLVTASDALRAELEPRSDFALPVAGAARGDQGPHPPAQDAHTRTAPVLVATFGIGFDSAAELLCPAGDNTARVRSEAAYAKLCGACPIPAFSGKTSRHRLM